MMWILIIWFTINSVAQPPVVVGAYSSNAVCQAAYAQIIEIKPKDATVVKAECNATEGHA